jgi:cellulose synthase/poly-beta-1,6-N-acetylglucosamine synthase-like glycosyltransferase
MARRTIQKNKLFCAPNSAPMSLVGSSVNGACYCRDTQTVFDREFSHANMSSLQTEISNETDTTVKSQNHSFRVPFVSIIVAAYNEDLVIDRLLRSCAGLTYPSDKFQIIIVDDSEDNTFDIIKGWKKKLPNLKVVHRSDRTGWKGGALNVALKYINEKSSYILFVDADNTLETDILESFVSRFLNLDLHGTSIEVIQGYPLPRIYCGNSDHSLKHAHGCSWVAKGIDFRLARRNIIEFIAKDHMNLPLQITGSLFMIKSDVMKSIRFSNDLSEDWDLTIRLYLRATNSSLYHKKGMNVITFDPLLVSSTEVTTRLIPYLRQRMRVSEGNTRGLRTNIVNILSRKMPWAHKIEILLTGLSYAKFIGVLALILIDFTILLVARTDFILSNDIIKVSFITQAANLFTALAGIFMSIPICRKVRNYNMTDVLALLLLNICTIPAFVIGSFRGMIRKDGVFYRTARIPEKTSGM